MTPHFALAASLERAQRRQRRRLDKVERTTAKLSRRTLKLVASEARIAAIEASLASSLPPERLDGIGRRSEPDDALLIFNPSSGRSGEDNALRLAQVVKGLRAHGMRVRVEIKTSGKAARAFAREAVKTGGGLVIVAGGDGTVGDVAAQLVGSQTVLGLIPIGTMNNLARSLGVPLDIAGACALIAMRTTRHIDAGRISAGDADKPDGGSQSFDYFFDCAGVGQLAVAAVAGQAFEKRRWSALPRAIRALFDGKPSTVQIELDGKVIGASTCMVTISNAPIMGNKLLSAPGAKMDDGLLDVSVYDGMGNVALAEHFLAVAKGSGAPVATYRARHIRITAAEPLLTSADMRVSAKRQVIEIAVVPGAIEMIVGNGIGLTLPVVSAPEAPALAPDPPTMRPDRAPDAGLADGLADGV